ncbi:uncharacterized protein SCHCODRAFT_02573703, partial [Schizophyllum commune H4-8]|uniref:uncharacterized protein n=1 Tax=Schizophyllum commune (strain H4-8 / FGSC 9210) TaxID=578458 RepID=UPI00215E64CA
MPTQRSYTAGSDSIETACSQLDRFIEGLLEQVTDLVDTITREQQDTFASVTALTLRQHTHASKHAIKRLSSRIPFIRRAQENKTLLSPVQWLPSELLSYIFVLAVPDLWLRAPSGGMALPFALVCSRWRAIALSTPQLWSHIAISSRQPWDEERRTTIRSRQDSDTLMSIANAYIARSAGAPLTVVYATHWVDLCYQRRVIDHQQRLNVCKRLLQESARWKAVKLECSMECFDCWTRVPFPGLESLNFGAVEDSVDGYNLISFFSDAPLRRLTVRGNILPPQRSVQWPTAWRLSHLHLADVSTCHIVEALAAFAPHLEDVEVRNNASSSTSRTACPFSTLPKLHTLEISGSAMPAIRLQAPALKRLVLSDG